MALPELEKWGVIIPDPEAEFNMIDKDKGKSISFDEFVDYAIKKQLDLEEDEE